MVSKARTQNRRIMTNTHIELIIDRSGSMQGIKRDMEGGLNSFIKEQAALPGKLTVTLNDFDTEFRTVFANRDGKEVPYIVIDPRGGTALYDAIGRSISKLELVSPIATNRVGWMNSNGQLSRFKKVGYEAPVFSEATKNIVVIVTDGEENSSREWKREAIKALVSKKREQGWEFIFLGANQDAVFVAEGMGIARTSSITYSPTYAGVTNSTQSLNSYASNVRLGNTAAFSDSDREKALV